MPRRHRSRRSIYRPLKTAKYSNETFAFAISRAFQEGQPSYVIVTAAAATLGTRKAKNFTLNFASSSSVPFFYCLVFVPEGTAPGPITAGSTVVDQTVNAAAFYNPNQNVIMSGVCLGGAAGIIRAKTRLARNLNSGDKLVLIFQPTITYEGNIQFLGTINYAISY